MSIKQVKIYMAGYLSIVCSSIIRALENQGQANFVLRTHQVHPNITGLFI